MNKSYVEFTDDDNYKIYGLMLDCSDDEILFITLDVIQPIVSPKERCRLISENEYIRLRKKALKDVIKRLKKFDAGELGFNFKEGQ